jgi:hypothetical protein
VNEEQTDDARDAAPHDAALLVSKFAIGTTTVMCAANDAAGNVGHASFHVHVKSASEQLADLLGQVTASGPGQGSRRKSLRSRTSSLRPTRAACAVL